MTIHHDKLAYGKLKSLNEELSADEIARLVEELNEEEEDVDNQKHEKNDTMSEDNK